MLNSDIANCRVCGYEPEDPPWGTDGRTPLFEYCPCCGVEWGYQDATPIGVERFRAKWLESGAPWVDPTVDFDGLTVSARLRRALS
jgi:hypothetical protein